jgi:hypothetical protein
VVRGTLLPGVCLALVAAIAVLVGGCGGGSDSTGTAGTGGGAEAKSGNGSAAEAASSLSKSEFVEKADAICNRDKRQGLAEMSTYVKEKGAESASPQAKIALLREALQAVFLPKVQDQIDEIRALGAPQGDEQEVEAFLAALQEGLDAASKAATPTNALFGQSFKRSGELARAYGLTACAYG